MSNNNNNGKEMQFLNEQTCVAGWNSQKVSRRRFTNKWKFKIQRFLSITKQCINFPLQFEFWKVVNQVWHEWTDSSIFTLLSSSIEGSFRQQHFQALQIAHFKYFGIFYFIFDRCIPPFGVHSAHLELWTTTEDWRETSALGEAPVHQATSDRSHMSKHGDTNTHVDAAVKERERER